MNINSYIICYSVEHFNIYPFHTVKQRNTLALDTCITLEYGNAFYSKWKEK